jgi:hypothetical protein
MKIEQIKVFAGTKELIEHYSFISNKKKDEIGCNYFWVPLEHQLKWLNNGLGTITYFEVIENKDSKNKNEGELKSTPFMYRMHSEFVKNLEMGDVLEEKTTYLKADGFDDCLIGIGLSFGRNGTLVYDQAKVIEKLEQQGMTNEEAFEYYEYNILGACLGDNMPIFVEQLSMKEVEDLLSLEKGIDYSNDS